MEAYFKENTGIKNPQGHNLDFFVIPLIGQNLIENESAVQIDFYLTKEDAIEVKIPPASRIADFAPLMDSIEEMKTTLFSMSEIETTAGDVIDLKDPIPQNL